MTVLKELAKQLPNENFIYLGDTKKISIWKQIKGKYNRTNQRWSRIFNK